MIATPGSRLFMYSLYTSRAGLIDKLEIFYLGDEDEPGPPVSQNAKFGEEELFICFKISRTQGLEGKNFSSVLRTQSLERKNFSSVLSEEHKMVIWEGLFNKLC